MSVDVTVFLVCDDCDRRAFARTSLETMAYLRCDEADWAEVREGRREGWRHYCPYCAAKRGLELGQSVMVEEEREETTRL